MNLKQRKEKIWNELLRIRKLRDDEKDRIHKHYLGGFTDALQMVIEDLPENPNEEGYQRIAKILAISNRYPCTVCVGNGGFAVSPNDWKGKAEVTGIYQECRECLGTGINICKHESTIDSEPRLISNSEDTMVQKLLKDEVRPGEKCFRCNHLFPRSVVTMYLGKWHCSMCLPKSVDFINLIE